MENDFHKRYNFRITKVETIFFIPTCTELNYLSIYVVCGYMLCRWTSINWTLCEHNHLNHGPKFF